MLSRSVLSRSVPQKSPSLVVGSMIVSFWTLCAIAPGPIARFGEFEAVRGRGTQRVITRQGPQSDAWFGTDGVGNDVFSRVIYGADNMVVGPVIAAFVSVIVGAVVGSIMGKQQGWVDRFLSWILDTLVLFPMMLLVLVSLMSFGYSQTVFIAAIAALLSAGVAKTVRDVVQTGMPNLSQVLASEFVASVGHAVLGFATLAFVGYRPGEAVAAHWAGDFGRNWVHISSGQWWVPMFPALALISLMIGINLISRSLAIAPGAVSTPGGLPGQEGVAAPPMPD